MQIKNVINFEMERDGKHFNFSVPMGATYGDAINTINELLQLLVKMSEEEAEKAKQTELKGE